MANINWNGGQYTKFMTADVYITRGLGQGQYTHQGHEFCILPDHSVNIYYLIWFFCHWLKLVKNKKKKQNKMVLHTQVQGKNSILPCRAIYNLLPYRAIYSFIAWPCDLFRPIIMLLATWANNIKKSSWPQTDCAPYIISRIYDCRKMRQFRFRLELTSKTSWKSDCWTTKQSRPVFKSHKTSATKISFGKINLKHNPG